EGNRLIISLSYSGVSRHSDRHQIEFCMFGVLRVCRMLTEQKLVPQHFSIAHHRSGANSEMVRFVGTKVEFGADRDEFALNAEAREFPLIHADPYLNNLLMKNCEAALADRRGDVSQLRRMKSLRCFLMKNARGRRCPQPGNEREDACTKAFNACEAPRHRTSYSTYRLTARAARRRSKRRSAWAVVKRGPATTRAIQLARIGMDQSPMMTVNSSAKWAAAGSLNERLRSKDVVRASALECLELGFARHLTADFGVIAIDLGRVSADAIKEMCHGEVLRKLGWCRGNLEYLHCLPAVDVSHHPVEPDQGQGDRAAKQAPSMVKQCRTLTLPMLESVLAVLREKRPLDMTCALAIVRQ